MNVTLARENIEGFIKGRGYTYSVESILSAYVQYYKNGYYVSHTAKDCIKHLKVELDFLVSQFDQT